MLSDIFERVVEISIHAGFYTLTLHSLNEKSTKFYRGLGFERYAGTFENPKMLMPLRTIRDLVNSEQIAANSKLEAEEAA